MNSVRKYCHSLTHSLTLSLTQSPILYLSPTLRIKDTLSRCLSHPLSTSHSHTHRNSHLQSYSHKRTPLMSTSIPHSPFLSQTQTDYHPHTLHHPHSLPNTHRHPHSLSPVLKHHRHSPLDQRSLHKQAYQYPRISDVCSL